MRVGTLAKHRHFNICVSLMIRQLLELVLSQEWLPHTVRRLFNQPQLLVNSLLRIANTTF